MSTQDKLAEALRVAREWLNSDKWRNSTIDKHKSWEAMMRGIDAALAEYDAHAAEAAQAQAQAQSGEWVMVPRKITPEMEDAADRRDDEEPPSDWGKMRNASRQAIWSAMLAAAPQPQAAEPVAFRYLMKISASAFAWSAWLPMDSINDRAFPGDKIEYAYTHPQPAQDAKDAANPLKGWIFDKVDIGRGDERYICTPDGANATTVRNESTSDHRERMLWLIADAMAKESGR